MRSAMASRRAARCLAIHFRPLGVCLVFGWEEGEEEEKEEEEEEEEEGGPAVEGEDGDHRLVVGRGHGWSHAETGTRRTTRMNDWGVWAIDDVLF